MFVFQTNAALLKNSEIQYKYTVEVKSLHTPCRICKMLILSTRENNSWIYKNDPVQKFTYTWFLILCCYLNDPQLCFSFSSHKLFGFPAFLCIWTLSNNDCMILRSIFSHWGQLRDSYATITEGSNAHWCSRRKNHALRGWRGENFLNLKIRAHWTYFVFWETCKYLLY